MRNTISGDYDTMVAREKNKIVTKTVPMSNWTHVEQMRFHAAASALIRTINKWVQQHPDCTDMHNYYTTFHIPKRSGGYRTIQAPNEELKDIQKKILNFLIEDCKILCHNSVHSYVKHRNCKTAMEAHQQSGARWFLKLDIKDFFDNCLYEPVLHSLINIHPLSLITEGRLRNIFMLCFLEGKLPQGAPTSPLLSNLYLLSADYMIDKQLKGFTYTRYADDILISKTTPFQYTNVVSTVTTFLPVNLTLKREKIRYGSCNGHNWNLGLMYNKDREITVGYRNKHRVKNMIHNLYTNIPEEGTPRFVVWLRSVWELKGILAYYQFIEPEYFTALIERYKAKGYDL